MAVELRPDGNDAGDDFRFRVRVQRESRRGRHDVLVEEAQGTEPEVAPVDLIPEAEGLTLVEPAEIKALALIVPADRDHADASCMRRDAPPAPNSAGIVKRPGPVKTNPASTTASVRAYSPPPCCESNLPPCAAATGSDFVGRCLFRTARTTSATLRGSRPPV